MPVLNDILEHKVIGPAILQGRQEGRKEGLEEGRKEGLEKGRHQFLASLVEKRFGSLPKGVKERISGLSTDELDAIAARLLDGAAFEPQT